jgi:hypothetical protein
MGSNQRGSDTARFRLTATPWINTFSTILQQVGRLALLNVKELWEGKLGRALVPNQIPALIENY